MGESSARAVVACERASRLTLREASEDDPVGIDAAVNLFLDEAVDAVHGGAHALLVLALGHGCPRRQHELVHVEPVGPSLSSTQRRRRGSAREDAPGRHDLALCTGERKVRAVCGRRCRSGPCCPRLSRAGSIATHLLGRTHATCHSFGRSRPTSGRLRRGEIGGSARGNEQSPQRRGSHDLGVASQSAVHQARDGQRRCRRVSRSGKRGHSTG